MGLFFLCRTASGNTRQKWKTQLLSSQLQARHVQIPNREHVAIAMQSKNNPVFVDSIIAPILSVFFFFVSGCLSRHIGRPESRATKLTVCERKWKIVFTCEFCVAIFQIYFVESKSLINSLDFMKTMVCRIRQLTFAVCGGISCRPMSDSCFMSFDIFVRRAISLFRLLLNVIDDMTPDNLPLIHVLARNTLG